MQRQPSNPWLHPVRKDSSNYLSRPGRDYAPRVTTRALGSWMPQQDDCNYQYPSLLIQRNAYMTGYALCSIKPFPKLRLKQHLPLADPLVPRSGTLSLARMARNLEPVNREVLDPLETSRETEFATPSEFARRQSWTRRPPSFCSPLSDIAVGMLHNHPCLRRENIYLT